MDKVKFSVLLPTRNRLELLKYAVETVTRQNYDNWEIIISDNCSEENVAGYVESLGDRRIKYFRTDAFIPVTDNWNNALEKSSGDYVIMLGDDDGLLKGFFATVSQLAERYDQPDVIYTRALLYAYPGVMPGSVKGFLTLAGCADFFKRAREPFFLDKNVALKLVKQSMNFRLGFDYNMQYFIVSRRVIDRLHHGKFFQSPYPDYYASNVLFLKANQILIYPQPLVVIGISPKSFGFFYYNGRERQGVEFLKNSADPEIVSRSQHAGLPVSNMNASWLQAMESVRSHYGSEFDLKVNHRRYRMLQVLHIYQQYRKEKTLTKKELRQFWQSLSLWERLSYKPRLWIAFTVDAISTRPGVTGLVRGLLGLVGPLPPFHVENHVKQYNTLLEVFDQVAPRQFDSKSVTQNSRP